MVRKGGGKEVSGWDINESGLRAEYEVKVFVFFGLLFGSAALK